MRFPIVLPPVSNREDYILTYLVNDDDLSSPVNIAGITLAPTNPNGFTGNAWTVTDGTIVTTSATNITIPGYPIGSQMASVALTVPPALGILAGDPIRIADTATGLNTMSGYVLSYNISTGALVCQISVTIQFEIRRGGPRMTNTTGYVDFYDFGTPDDLGPLLAASLGYPNASTQGITIVDIGYIQVLFPEAVFKTLGSAPGGPSQPSGGNGTFNVGMTMFDGLNTRQLLIATLPVFYGGVTL